VKHFLLINASPRVKGTSAMLAQTMREYLLIKGHDVSLVNLYPNLSKMDAIVDAFAKADVLAVIGPCYINTYPADTYALMETLAQHPEACHGQAVYGVIQGGMPYAHTHRSGLSALRLFSKACALCSTARPSISCSTQRP
jgi:multimeric flavodoxin WrbA